MEYELFKYNSQDTGKMIHLGDLMKWCDDSSNYPAEVDATFVLSHEIVKEKNSKGFRFCMTTPRLLEMLSSMQTICIDATYKLNWMGLPLIILGTVDRMKRFHPMIYACTSRETTADYAFVFSSVKKGIATYIPEKLFAPKRIIADGAEQIRNAFYEVFEESAEIDIMCFAHVIRNIRKRPFASKNSKPLILDEIRKMQLAPNRTEFELMTNLFIKKWQSVEPNFIEYFRREWLGGHTNWLEGAAHYTPSTNNALESHNATIKKK